MKFIELYDNYDYLFSVAVPIIAWIIGFLCHRLSDKIRANKLKRILHTSKGKYELVLPVRKGFLDTDKSSTPLKWDYVTFEESLVIHEIRSMLDEIDIGADDFTLSKDDDSISVHNNVFCIGGPMVNSYVVSNTLGIDDKRTYPLYRTFSMGISVQF